MHARSLSHEKNGEGRSKKKKKGNKSKSIYEAWPLTLAQAFPAFEYLQTLFLFLPFLLQALHLTMGLWSWLLVLAHSQAPAPGPLPDDDKKSLQSLSCSAINVTARQLH